MFLARLKGTKLNFTVTMVVQDEVLLWLQRHHQQVQRNYRVPGLRGLRIPTQPGPGFNFVLLIGVFRIRVDPY